MAGPADWGAIPADKPAPSGDGPAAWGARPVEQEAAVPPPESSGISGVDPVQNWLPGIPGIDQGIEIAGGAAKGLASIPVGVGQLALELDDVAEVDVNPLRIADGAVRAADALIVLAQSN